MKKLDPNDISTWTFPGCPPPRKAKTAPITDPLYKWIKKGIKSKLDKTAT
jgi:hypothetical protein